jgi:hypothetical protein
MPVKYETSIYLTLHENYCTKNINNMKDNSVYLPYLQAKSIKVM